MKPRRPAASYTDQLRTNDASQQYYAGLSGKEVPEKWLNNVGPKRTRAKQVVTAASESQILKAIMQLLRQHPKVARVWRNNSGTFQVDNRWIRANTARGMSDIMGILKDGRMLAIEVKTATGAVLPHQHDFLVSITKAGGIAFIARDVDTVARVLSLEK